MYDELIKRLQDFAAGTMRDADAQLAFEAAGAIEELQAQLMYSNDAARAVAEKVPKWIMIESRPMDEEERWYYSELYGYNLTDDEAVIYCCQLPEHGQEVLVCNKYGHIWLDTFDDDPDYGVGFETNGDMDGLVAWMPLPMPTVIPADRS